MSKDYKTFIPNPTTVSCRLECIVDLQFLTGILHTYSNMGHVIDYRVHLNKDNIPIVEPYLEITLQRELLPSLIHDMKTHATSELHVALDTLREVPMEQNSMERDFSKQY